MIIARRYDHQYAPCTVGNLVDDKGCVAASDPCRTIDAALVPTPETTRKHAGKQFPWDFQSTTSGSRRLLAIVRMCSLARRLHCCAVLPKRRDNESITPHRMDLKLTLDINFFGNGAPVLFESSIDQQQQSI